MPDGKTIVGRDYSNSKSLVSEDITNNTSSQIGTLSSSIYSVIFDPKTRSLFAGDASGCLHMYQKSTDSDSFTLVKDFGNIGIGEIWSSTFVNDLAFFGGYNTYSLRAVMISEQRLVEGTLKTAFKNICSLETIKISKKQVLLSVAGYGPSYSSTSSDIYRVEASPEETQSEPETSQNESISQMETRRPGHSSFSEEIMLTLLSKVLAYVETLFREFTKQSKQNEKQVKGKYWLFTVTKVEQKDTVSESELTDKLQRIIKDFKLEAQGKKCFVYFHFFGGVPYL